MTERRRVRTHGHPFRHRRLGNKAFGKFHCELKNSGTSGRAMTAPGDGAAWI
jgi:hypothetical protein